MDKSKQARFIIVVIYLGVLITTWATLYIRMPEKLTLVLNMLFFFFITIGSDLLMVFEKVFRTSSSRVSGLTIVAMVFLWTVLFTILKFTL